MVLFTPAGLIAEGERNLMITNVSLMLVAAIPTFIALIIIAQKYKSSNTNTKYMPEWSFNVWQGIALWSIPTIILIIMGVNTWIVTHKLDPLKPINSTTPPLTIQVVALQWKWLFIYPQQNIATVNYIEFPAKTPIHFELTANAPMNSFWIPKLSGQMYAMAGMSTQLNMIADQPGEYQGSAAELSGQGFAGMRFTAKATSQSDFEYWIQSVKRSPNSLSFEGYNQLALPSEDTPVTVYSSVDNNLYNKIILSFMAPSDGNIHIPVMQH